MDYTALKTLLSDPTYTSLSDADAAAAVNTKSVAVQGDIPISQALTWCATNGVLTALQSGAAAAGPLQNACLAAMTMFNTLTATFELSSANIQGLIAGLASGNVITQDQATNLLQQGQAQQPWPLANGYGRLLDWADIHAARAS